MHTERIADLELLIGHHFRDKSYIENALSHSSIKTTDRPSNERLEFLGDSVLGLIISDALYRRFPEDDEGTLTRIKSQAVSRATLQRIAAAMGLDRYLMVGKGVAKREIPASLLGNLFEAIVGAIYLDAGLASSRKFILRHLDVVIHEIIEDRAEKNYKSLLQHYCQRDLGAVPTYRVLRESGPAHGRAFEVVAVVGSKEYGRARAASKKEAEQGAARAALIHFKQVEEEPGKPRRGAGVIVRVGATAGTGKKRRKRGGRRARGERPAAAHDLNEAERSRGDRPFEERTASPRDGREGDRTRRDAPSAERPAPSREGRGSDRPRRDLPSAEKPATPREGKEGCRRRRSGRRKRPETPRDAQAPAVERPPVQRSQTPRAPRPRQAPQAPQAPQVAREPSAPGPRAEESAKPARKKTVRKKAAKKAVVRKKATKKVAKKKSKPATRKRKKSSDAGADGVE